MLSVAISADDQYSMQLAVAIRSLIDTLPEGQEVRLFILDGGISASNRDRCLESWGCDRLSVEWISPDADTFADMPVSARFTVASYYRVSAAELLPLEVDRILFTDPDVLFFKNPSSLLQIDLQGRPIGAVQDAYCPFVDNRRSMPNFRRAKGHVFERPAIPNLSPRSDSVRQPYFNAGFMVMDLKQFRREKIGEQLLDYCRMHRDQLIWADQCALNACLGHRWLPLDDAWNVTPPVFQFPSHEESHYDAFTLERIRRDPAMVHFAGASKPWHFGCQHHYVHAYWKAIDRTSWKHWRPDSRHQAVPTPHFGKRPTSPSWKILPGRVQRWLKGA